MTILYRLVIMANLGMGTKIVRRILAGLRQGVEEVNEAEAVIAGGGQIVAEAVIVGEETGGGVDLMIEGEAEIGAVEVNVGEVEQTFGEAVAVDLLREATIGMKVASSGVIKVDPIEAEITADTMTEADREDLMDHLVKIGSRSRKPRDTLFQVYRSTQCLTRSRISHTVPTAQVST